MYEINYLAQNYILVESSYPRHVIPNAWRTYNNKFGIRRGLFFMDGIEWKETRRKMDPLLLKKDSYEKYALPWSFKVTDLLMEKWSKRLEETTNVKSGSLEKYEIQDLEMTMHKWSVESTLASLFGSSFFCLGENYLNIF